MTWTPTEPQWTVPSLHEIADLHWLAYADATESGSGRAAGIVATLAWVRGGQTAPVTGREERPVSQALAEAELWVARAALAPDAAPPAHALSQTLGVDYCPPLDVPPTRAEGTAATLGWLLGTNASPPLPLPARRPDGQLADAHELVEAAMASAPLKIWGPEQRHAARNEAQATVERSRRLTARIAAARQRVQSG
ncbi:hypothetical protein [Pseudonocardia sp. NPDC049154]|uniref:hypothetical protein n=1 Tax=Pseudonocardia sp. NPDC049154 TaxID=3155501 RepID=UPI0033DD0E6D